MKVLMICGSAREGSNSRIALEEMRKLFDAQKIESEIVTVGRDAVHGCTGCRACYKTGRCVNDDGVYELADKFETADGLVIASPVHYASRIGAKRIAAQSPFIPAFLWSFLFQAKRKRKKNN